MLFHISEGLLNVIGQIPILANMFHSKAVSKLLLCLYITQLHVQQGETNYVLPHTQS